MLSLFVGFSCKRQALAPTGMAKTQRFEVSQLNVINQPVVDRQEIVFPALNTSNWDF